MLPIPPRADQSPLSHAGAMIADSRAYHEWIFPRYDPPLYDCVANRRALAGPTRVDQSGTNRR